MKKKPLLSGKKLTLALDDAIRKYYHTLYPNPTCFVCKHRHGWYHPKTNRTGCQIGHYVSRQYFALRWDFQNIFPQCSGCNVKHNHNPIPFTKAIVAEYNQERIDYLDAKCRDYKNMTTLEKRALLDELWIAIDNLNV